MKILKQYILWFTGLQLFHFLILTYWISTGISAIYGTNDDSLMASIASGFVTGENDEHLIFIEPIFSLIIKYLEIILPNFSGYSLFILFVTTSAFVSILTSTIVFKKINLFFLSFYLLAFISLLSWFAINPTYTGASLFAAGAAAANINFSIFRDEKANNAVLYFVFSIFCFIAYAIRNEGLYIAILLSIPGLIFTLKHKIDLRNNLKFLLFPFITLFIVNFFISESVYSKKWNDYLNLNSLRHQIQLREPERRLKDHLDDLNWDESTYFMFTKFNLVDKTKMNSKNMEKIINVTKVSYLSSINILNTYQIIKKEMQLWTWILKFILFLLLLALLLNIITKRVLKFIIYNLTLLLAGLIFLIILANFYQLPERITFNFLSALMLSLLTNFIGIKNHRNLFFNVILILFMIYGLDKYYDRFKIELTARQNMYQTRIVYANNQKLSFLKLNSEKVIAGASSIKSDWQNPYVKFKPIDPRNNTLILGWHNLSPIWLTQVQDLNFNFEDLYLNLLESKTYWMDNPEEISKTKEFLEIHFDHKLELIKIQNIGNDEYFLYQFERVNL